MSPTARSMSGHDADAARSVPSLVYPQTGRGAAKRTPPTLAHHYLYIALLVFAAVLQSVAGPPGVRHD
jgi:hypothetical protein